MAAISHDVVVVHREDRPGDGGQQVHPGAGRVHVPLIERGGDAALLEEAPAPDAGELALSVPLEEMRFLDLGRPDEELELVGKLRLPDVSPVLTDPVLVSLLELVGFEHTMPPLGPALGLVDRVPDPLTRGLEQPGCQEAVFSHACSVPGRRLTVAELSAWPFDDLREPD